MPQSLDLGGRAIRGVFWSAIERFGPQAIQFIVSVILARLLLPEEFGLVAMLTVFIALGKVLLDSGFVYALVQKKNATEVDFSSVFYLNLFIGLACTAILCFTAPIIARFYGEPLLTPLTRVLSLNFVFGAFGLVQIALLMKKLDFRVLARATLVASVGSGGVAIGMALLGFGIWSLVAQSLSLVFFTSLLLWAFSTWRPQAVFSLAVLRDLFGFASRLLVSGVLDTIFSGIYTVVIGKVFSPATLGYYMRAYSLQQLPAETFAAIVSRVMFPVFSEIQDDLSRLRDGFRQTIRAVGMINFPLMIGLIVCAKPLILVLFTEKWIPAVPFLQMLAVVGLFVPLNSMNLNVLLARGRSDLYLRLILIKVLIILIVLVFTARLGIKAILAGQIVSTVMIYVLASSVNHVIVGHGTKAQARDLWPYLATAGIMGGVVYALTWLLFAHPFMLLLTQVVLGCLLYVILCRSFRLPVFMDAWNHLEGRLVALRTT